MTGGRSEYNGIDNDYTTFQFGYDHKLGLSEDVWVGGAFSYTNGDTDHEVGSGDNRVLAFTGCATWLRDNGAYLDVTLRYGTLRNSFDLVSAKGTFNTQALSAAVEASHRFELPANTFVEPALGLTYSHIFGEDYVSNAAEGAVAIEQDGIDSAVARAGFRAGFACPNNMAGVYLRAFYNYDFAGETTTRVVGYKTIDQDFGGNWYELGLGANVNISESLRAWADFKQICQMCHGPDQKNPQTPTIDTCTVCHPKDALVAKTAKVKPSNPHKSPHYGADLDCTNCHLGHMESENFCDQCHQFGFKVP